VDDALREFARSGSPDAFRLIVQAHADAVYSQSLRELRDRTLAEEVSQTVFLTLAKKARGLPERTPLAAWLFKATRYCCATTRRSEARRLKREGIAMRMRPEESRATEDDNGTWSEAHPLLDDAIAGLGTTDRSAILLRFIQGQSLRDVGVALGVSEDAAKQRVSRAVDRLRKWFAARGVGVVPSVAVLTWLESAVRPAPVDLVRRIGSSSLPMPAMSGWRYMRWPAAAAGILIGAIVAGGLVNAADPARPTAAAAPSTAPDTNAVDQTSPLGTMRKLSAAIRANDRTAIEACITDGQPDSDAAKKSVAFTRSVIFMDAANCRITHACQAAFGDQMKLKDFGFDVFPGLKGGLEAMIDKSLEIDKGNPAVQVDGDHASITIRVPADQFGGAPWMNLGSWSGAALNFTRDNGAWKLDLARSIHVACRINAAGAADPVTTERQAIDAVTKRINDVAEQVEKGQVDSPTDVTNMVESAARQVFKDFRITQMNMGVRPASRG
jgi:RNA polymerase sigma factor (sigma-70 family)